LTDLACLVISGSSWEGFDGEEFVDNQASIWDRVEQVRLEMLVVRE